MTIPGGRFWDNVEPEPNSGCWLWAGSVNKDGYASLTLGGRTVIVHRLSYIQHKGDIPSGLELDHKCRVRCCVNPAHLEPVTHAENVRRGMSGTINGARQSAKTHCPHGHAYEGRNVYTDRHGRRYCRICAGKRNREAHAKRRLRQLQSQGSEGQPIESVADPQYRSANKDLPAQKGDSASATLAAAPQQPFFPFLC